MITSTPAAASPASPPPPPLRWGERTLLIAVLTLAFLGGIGAVLATGIGIAGEFIRDSFLVTALTDTAVVPEQAGGTAVLQGGDYASAQLLVGGLSLGAVTLIVLGQVIGMLTVAIGCAAVARFCTAVLTGRAVQGSVARAVTVLGLAILVGGVLGQLVTGLGDVVAGFELMGSLDDPVYPGTLFDGTAFAVGGTMLAVVAAFRLGTRMPAGSGS